MEVLDRIVNHTELKLVCCSWFRPEQVVQEWNIPASSVFNFSAGPLVVTLETGLVVGFASIPEKASMTVWVEETVPQE